MTPEGALQKLILDWLQAKQILAFRMNSGMMKIDKRFVRFGVVGMADIVAFYQINECAMCGPIILPVWIEVKADTRQSVYQKSFQQQVEAAGHRYILAKSLEDVENALD